VGRGRRRKIRGAAYLRDGLRSRIASALPSALRSAVQYALHHARERATGEGMAAALTVWRRMLAIGS
jgi:hypothetical protein